MLRFVPEKNCPLILCFHVCTGQLGGRPVPCPPQGRTWAWQSRFQGVILLMAPSTSLLTAHLRFYSLFSLWPNHGQFLSWTPVLKFPTCWSSRYDGLGVVSAEDELTSHAPSFSGTPWWHSQHWFNEIRKCEYRALSTCALIFSIHTSAICVARSFTVPQSPRSAGYVEQDRQVQAAAHTPLLPPLVPWRIKPTGVEGERQNRFRTLIWVFIPSS